MTTGTPTPGGTGVPTGAALGVTFTTSGACATAGPTRAKDNRVAVMATRRMLVPPGTIRSCHEPHPRPSERLASALVQNRTGVWLSIADLARRSGSSTLAGPIGV